MTTTQHDTPSDTTRHTTHHIDLWKLGHHLSIARHKYAEDYEVMKSAGGAFTRVAEEFARMHDECRVLEELLQVGEDVEVRLIGDVLYVSGQVWE